MSGDIPTPIIPVVGILRLITHCAAFRPRFRNGRPQALAMMLKTLGEYPDSRPITRNENPATSISLIFSSGILLVLISAIPAASPTAYQYSSVAAILNLTVVCSP
jgi:hypothetical protein